MKEVSRVIFGIVFLFFFVQLIGPLGYYAYFKWNQTEIAEKFCENKDKPKLECNGKCHLKKTVSKITEIKKEKIPEKNTPKVDVKKEVWFCNEYTLLEIPSAFGFVSKNHFYHENYSLRYNTKIFHPPQF